MVVLIRPAKPSDEGRILELMEELMLPPSSRPGGYTRERALAGVRWALASPEAEILLAEDGREVVGLATLYRVFPSIRHGWRCWLQDLVVTSSRRDSGVGRALLDASADWARGRGCDHLMLDSGNARKDAHRFYLREGMAQESLTFKRELR